MEAIRLEKVRKRYGKDVLALDKVSLLVEEGELFFLSLVLVVAGKLRF